MISLLVLYFSFYLLLNPRNKENYNDENTLAKSLLSLTLALSFLGCIGFIFVFLNLQNFPIIVFTSFIFLIVFFKGDNYKNQFLKLNNYFKTNLKNV